ncbi:aldo/keto reductase [Dellaglioa algida]|uniref:aldo/keto reductase n=1 Tax=Dellaglioa algida TaxID=105612 RepID=UPI0024C4DBE3|nr:aldo/keto reductase [Dellaglioa algida]MDK1728845.1 aldo/keto reductase [Dellaglioa algida]MDK1736545.1 aldo/keto reductase [Dellaglioa algida]MDK1738184.1 aldo/keto reductase [Dellaglioa algida]
MYQANEKRYDKMIYNRLGNSGLKVSAIALGLWKNFGDETPLSTQKDIIETAFDNGITYFDLANNYGDGAAEKNFGRILREDLSTHRDEMVISTKAGYYMWPGPYGEWGSKKNLFASMDQSLERMQLDYVDIFYHHRPDPNTPLEETAEALDLLVRQGKALYVGISNYRAPEAEKMIQLLKAKHTPIIVHQPRYNLLDRWIEDGLKDVLKQEQIGTVAFSPLAQGLLTDRYLNGIPDDSRVKKFDSLKEERVEKTIVQVKGLNEIAINRGQTLAEMALSWDLKDDSVSSVIIGASRVSQLMDNLKALEHLEFSAAELAEIDNILG